MASINIFYRTKYLLLVGKCGNMEKCNLLLFFYYTLNPSFSLEDVDKVSHLKT